jgi:hypothetical protein
MLGLDGAKDFMWVGWAGDTACPLGTVPGAGTSLRLQPLDAIPLEPALMPQAP